jgi:hypothetical protein
MVARKNTEQEAEQETEQETGPVTNNTIAKNKSFFFFDSLLRWTYCPFSPSVFSK